MRNPKLCDYCNHGIAIGQIGYLKYCKDHKQLAFDEWDEMRKEQPEMTGFFEKKDKKHERQPRSR